MSIWTSKAALILLLVSGCVMPDTATGVRQGSKAPAEQRQSLMVSGVKLAGPSGFCPLPETRQQVAAAGFVAFAPCDGADGTILTATVGAQDSADGIILTKTTMAPYFRTAQGIAALRGAGNRDGIAVHEVRDYKEAVILRISRKSTAGESMSWRALMRADGHLVTLTVRPPQGQRIDARRIAQFIDAVRGANRL